MQIAYNSRTEAVFWYEELSYYFASDLEEPSLWIKSDNFLHPDEISACGSKTESNLIE